MIRQFSYAILLASLLASCNRQQAGSEIETSRAQDERRMASRNLMIKARSPATAGPRKSLSSAAAEYIHDLRDDQLALRIETLLEGSEEEGFDDLLSALYDAIELRAACIRLPVLLELARRDTGATGVRATALAELRGYLEEDHGESWSDWALALSEHLPTREGFLPVDANFDAHVPSLDDKNSLHDSPVPGKGA